MGIRFYCTECGRRLNIKAFLAGKRGICPHCDARVQIPHESQIPDDAPKFRPTSDGSLTVAQATTSVLTSEGSSDDVAQDFSADERLTDPIAEAPDAVWYVRPPTGGQYGPARGDVMRRWIDEGRVSADSMVWREGWTDWETAGPLFPSLGATGVVSEPASVGRSEPAPSLITANHVETAEAPASTMAMSGAASRKKSLLPLIALGLLIVVLLVVTVVVVSQG